MTLLAHELRDLLDDCEAVADFFSGWRPGGDEGDPCCWAITDPAGNVWPFEQVEHFLRWENSIRTLRQLVSREILVSS